MGRIFRASDAFPAAPLSTANWGQTNNGIGGDVQVAAAGQFKGQYAVQPTDQKGMARWKGAGVFAAAQYSEIVLNNPLANTSLGDGVGVTVRCTADIDAAKDCYCAYTSPDHATTPSTYITKWLNGARTQLASGALAWAANDKLGLEVDEVASVTTLYLTKNGVRVGGSFTVTDTTSPITAAGAPGITAAGANSTGGAWEAGDVTVSTFVFSGSVPSQSGSVGSPFSWTGSALSSYFTGGTSPYTYSIFSGALPAGLALNTSTGVISGTPTVANTPSGIAVVVRATDSLAAVQNTGSFTITVSGAAATTTTLSGPSTGVTGSASTAFTVGANGVISGTLVVTPSDGGGGGVFSPTSVSITSAAPTATFSYTPASNGAKAISVTNGGGLTNAASLTYTATAAGGSTGRLLFSGASDVFVDNTGTALASGTVTFCVHHATTGALIAQVTGVTGASGLLAGGVVSASPMALSTLYRVDYKFGTGEYGVVYRTSEAT